MNRTRQDARIIVGPRDGVRLSRSGASVGKYSRRKSCRAGRTESSTDPEVNNRSKQESEVLLLFL